MIRSRRKALTLPIRITLVLIVIGFLFKIQHWSFASELIIFSSISLMALYVIRFFFKKVKALLDYIKLFIVILWVSINVINILHLFNVHYIFNFTLLGLLCLWFINEGTSYFNDNRKLKKGRFFKTLYYTLCFITLFLIICGMLFKIQHWPYGSILVTFGLILLSIMLLLDYFITE